MMTTYVVATFSMVCLPLFFRFIKMLNLQKNYGIHLNPKYMVEDASSKKFMVSNFMGYKMIDTKPITE